MRSCIVVGVLLALPFALIGCNRGANTSATNDVDLGHGYKLIATKIDDSSSTKCREQAEDLLNSRPSVGCLVGLWEYNPPALLGALRSQGKKIPVVAFDENDETLTGIKDGRVEGTIVQDPYEFGYKSIEILAKMVLDKNDDVLKTYPGIEKGNSIFVAHDVITKANVEKFEARVKGIKSEKHDPGDVAKKPKVAFVSNNAFEFWTFAEKGAQKAAAKYGVQLVFRKPRDGSPATQRNDIQDLMNDGVVGFAVSPNEPKNSQDFFKTKVLPKVKLLMVDNDLPDTSARLAYIGTHNYRAGRAAGDLVKKALPKGGEVAIFVGSAGASNAIERRQGVLDVLAGKDQKEMTDVTPNK